MEHPKWEKDRTPYLVFSCTRCKQYSYVKTIQKTKKCLRCGKTHQVKSILKKGQIVEGITSAMKLVKKLENLIGNPSFHTDDEFRIGVELGPHPEFSEKSIEKNFSLLLDSLSSQYQHFPIYLIRLVASDYHISEKEIPLLIRKALREGQLSKKDNYYRVIK
jgi:hypothetical protein